MSVPSGRTRRPLFSTTKTFKKLVFTEDVALPPVQPKWTLNQKLMLYIVIISAASTCFTIGIYTKDKKWMYMGAFLIVSILIILTCRN